MARSSLARATAKGCTLRSLKQVVSLHFRKTLSLLNKYLQLFARMTLDAALAALAAASAAYSAVALVGAAAGEQRVSAGHARHLAALALADGGGAPAGGARGAPRGGSRSSSGRRTRRSKQRRLTEREHSVER